MSYKPRLHDIDSDLDHGVGTLTPNMVAVNIGGVMVSSAAAEVKAQGLVGTSYLKAEVSTIVKGDVALAGFANGGAVYSNLASAPLKFVHTNRTDGANNIACAIVYDANAASIDDEMIISTTGWTNNADAYKHCLDVMDQSLLIPSWATADAPPAADHTGEVAGVTDGDTGSPCLAVSNGTNWLRIALGVAIASS